jgi:pimeloyl-ACP methyl ester carboxylesterase
MHVDAVDDHARLDWLALEAIMHAPPSSMVLRSYFCNQDPTTAHLPHWRFGTAASMAVQSYILPDASIDAGFDRGPSTRLHSSSLTLCAGISDFEGKVLLVSGSCNTLIGPEHQRRFHLPLFQHASLEVVEGAGHTLIGEAPEKALVIIRAHLDAVQA